MLKKDLTLTILKQIDHYLQEKIKKVTGLMKDELGGETMKKNCWIKSKKIQLLESQ